MFFTKLKTLHFDGVDLSYDRIDYLGNVATDSAIVPHCLRQVFEKGFCKDWYGLFDKIKLGNGTKFYIKENVEYKKEQEKKKREREMQFSDENGRLLKKPCPLTVEENEKIAEIEHFFGRNTSFDDYFSFPNFE